MTKARQIITEMVFWACVAGVATSAAFVIATPSLTPAVIMVVALAGMVVCLWVAQQ